ncbi:MAG TPA: tRNA (adenosine(37)-N6)-threonylcarbamoyltransferase complex transferase subunit TsaD, partial [Candidatus Hydrogenedentes bacterium]|nr:tRNA (adenosine(37)-N6)-threonylcarbamoyltransferase complex transferase subunit TsaD [Candidatus Hydrogenedentota bacterium]
MRVLGIETSCDETGAAVVEEGRRILSNEVASQIAVHAEFGGVVPEIASRQHIVCISQLVNKALEDAGCTAGDIDAIAVTNGPGLMGSLLVG